MNTLNVNYEELTTLGNNVLSKKEEFQAILNKITSTNDSLKGSWNDDAAKKFGSAVEEQAVTMQKLSTTIEEIGNSLKSIANAYRNAMEANRDSINM